MPIGVGPVWLVPASAEDDPPGANAACGPLPSDRRGHSVLSASGLSSDAATAGQALSAGTVWPCGVSLVITNPATNTSVLVPHVDNGAGSDGIRPVIGLYPQTRADLGLDVNAGSYQVQIQTTPGAPAINPVRGQQVASPGGVFGAGGTGTAANRASLWTVGDPSNPDQDYWTTVNQYSMDAQFYTFSDAETLFVTDGIQLMGQQPRAVIRRTDPAVLQARCVYDNTAFMFAATHKHRNHVQRRTSLARLTSPTEVTLNIVCDIDAFRAGDTVHLVMFGPADGVWLIGDCIRNAFMPYSELTLVQAMQPINAATGTPNGPLSTTGPSASKPGAGTVIAAMISEASTLNNDNYPYVYAGGHAQAGTPSVGAPGNGFDGHTKGFDCSGAVAAVLAAGGLWQLGSGVPADNGIISQLQGENKILPGQGSGNPECTLFDNPGVHIFMRLNGQYFGTEDGAGHLPATPSQGAGWIPNGSPGSFIPYHVPATILGQQAA